MSRHVDHYLIAYVEGQLQGRYAAKVRRHVAECESCGDKLANHQRVAADLRLALGQSPMPRGCQMDQWWQAIISVPYAPEAEARSWMPSALVPALLTLLLLILPLKVGMDRAHATVSGQAITAVSPAVDATNIPPTEIAQTQEAARGMAQRDATMAPLNSMAPSVTPAPVLPAPQAP